VATAVEDGAVGIHDPGFDLRATKVDGEGEGPHEATVAGIVMLTIQVPT
jgi:hypothetical protein